MFAYVREKVCPLLGFTARSRFKDKEVGCMRRLREKVSPMFQGHQGFESWDLGVVHALVE